MSTLNDQMIDAISNISKHVFANCLIHFIVLSLLGYHILTADPTSL